MFQFMKVAAIATGIALIATSTPVYAHTNTSALLSACRRRAATAYGTQPRRIVAKFEGHRVDGTHAVNFTYTTPKVIYTGQCSFNSRGTNMRFIKNRPYSRVDEGAL